MSKSTLRNIAKDGQKANPEGPGEKLDFHMEVASAANVLRFFEEYFNVVGDGTARLTDADGYALAHIFGLCSKHLNSVL